MLTQHLITTHLALTRIAARAGGRLRAHEGQGTIEYVGLMLLMSIVLAAVVAAGRKSGDAGITEVIIEKVKGAIDGVGEAPSRG